MKEKFNKKIGDSGVKEVLEMKKKNSKNENFNRKHHQYLNLRTQNIMAKEILCLETNEKMEVCVSTASRTWT